MVVVTVVVVTAELEDEFPLLLPLLLPEELPLEPEEELVPEEELGGGGGGGGRGTHLQRSGFVSAINGSQSSSVIIQAAGGVWAGVISEALAGISR